jgi:hypothetical protein
MAKKKETRPEVSFHDVETGEVVVREMNDEEYTEYTNNLAASALKREQELKDLQKREETIAKLVELGLTEEGIRAVLKQ